MPHTQICGKCSVEWGEGNQLCWIYDASLWVPCGSRSTLILPWSSPELVMEWTAELKFRWETWPLCTPLLVLQHRGWEHNGGLSSTDWASITYQMCLCSVTRVADIIHGSSPRNASRRIIQQDPLKHQCWRAEIDFLCSLFLSSIAGFLGFPCSAGLMTFDTNRCKAN